MQPFHHVRFEWPKSRSLEIEWIKGREGAVLALPATAWITSCTDEEELDDLGFRGIPPICWRDGEGDVFEPLQLRENTEYLVDVHLPLSLDEAVEAWNSSRSWPLETINNAYASDPPKRWHVTDAGVTVTGRLDFRSYVGAAELSVPGAEPIGVEVVCTKLSYFSDFRAILDAIAEEYSSLLLEVEAPTFARFTLADASSPQLMTFLFLLRHAMDDDRLPCAVEGILATPRSALLSEQRNAPVGQQQAMSVEEIINRLPQARMQSGGPLGAVFRGYTPTSLPETVKRETFDTPENRYVKAFLENLLDASDELRAVLERYDKTLAARQVATWSMRISEWLQHPIWNDVRRMTHFPSNSQVLQKSASYREVLATDLRMQLGMSLPWAGDNELETEVRGDLRPISQLYEYWCFFFLRSVMRQICGHELQDQGSLIRESGEGLAVVLKRGRESKLTFRYQDDTGRTARISLFYNRKFQRTSGSNWSGSYSAVLNPDFSILIEVIATGLIHWLHFDAKYRLDFDEWKTELQGTLDILPTLESELTSQEEARQNATYKRSDLFKMHTYRDALLGSRGSYILYPGMGDSAEVFVRYPGVEYSEDTKSIPSVGAFQASPTGQSTQSQHLESFIVNCVTRLVAAAGYQEESGIIEPEQDFEA